jgi:choline dehydrogenase
MRSRSFDVVVIGAGSAGCAVAGRLTEDPTVSVLLLEAGGTDRRLSIRAPLAYSAQMRGATDRDFTTEPEPGCADRRLVQPCGKVLGGTSSMNAMLWVRGSRLRMGLRPWQACTTGRGHPAVLLDAAEPRLGAGPLP